MTYHERDPGNLIASAMILIFIILSGMVYIACKAA